MKNEEKNVILLKLIYSVMKGLEKLILFIVL